MYVLIKDKIHRERGGREGERERGREGEKGEIAIHYYCYYYLMFSIAPFFIVRKHKVVLYTSKVYEVSDVYITVEVSFSFLSVSLSHYLSLSLSLSLLVSFTPPLSLPSLSLSLRVLDELMPLLS